MKTLNRILGTALAVMLLFTIFTNIHLIRSFQTDNGRPYRVEISRIVQHIEKYGDSSVDLSDYSYITNIQKYNGDSFYTTDSDYTIREIHGVLYRFDYVTETKPDYCQLLIPVNLLTGILILLFLSVMIWIRQKILLPFTQLTEIPYELAKGNLTVPVRENKNHLFGRFLWGIDLLRENMEAQKQRELALQKEKKTLLLSLSHDIKTPLSAIKLYSKALSKGLYPDPRKQLEITENINAKADEIESFVAQIIHASREDFLDFHVEMGEFYLSVLLKQISDYYREKLSLIRAELAVMEYSDCLLKGDPDRSVEVLQNILENAVKYGDGKILEISVGKEEGCILITVRNSGCSLPPEELPHIFESFWQGSNADTTKGSGLGLYICRQLMHRMNGEIFAEIKDHCMIVTVVFGQA